MTTETTEIQKIPAAEEIGLEHITNAVPEVYRENVTALFRLLNPAESDLEFGDIDTSRFVYRPPMIRVKQPVSQTNILVKNGDLYSPDTGEILERPLKLIPIFTWENRMKFVQGEREVCISEDKERSTSGLECATCPDRPWKDRQRQECNDYLHFLFVTPDFSKEIRMYKMSFSGTSAKAGRGIISQCMSAGRNLWTRVYAISSEEVKGTKGMYYPTTATFVEESPKDMQAAGAYLNKLLKKARLALKAENAAKLAATSAAVSDALQGSGMADFSNM